MRRSICTLTSLLLLTACGGTEDAATTLLLTTDEAGDDDYGTAVEVLDEMAASVRVS